MKHSRVNQPFVRKPAGINPNNSLPATRAKLRRDPEVRLTSKVFDYHRVGFDHRLMTFLEGGVVGQGARGREMFWSLKQNTVVLEISSDDGLTCRLEEGVDLVWRGNWLCCERMPVVLTPLKPWNEPAPTTEPMPESLFVVSLPRSLSTQVYHCARTAVGLHAPLWTTAGEILNLDRFALYQGPTHDANKKFLHYSSNPQDFCATSEFLDQLASPEGYAYKDVVQPFVVAEWIKRRKIRTIHIRRNIADVAFSMLQAGWLYPTRLFPKIKNKEVALIRGLMAAEKALTSISATCIDFDDLIQEEEVLRSNLENLYPNKKIKPTRFIDDQFKAVRKQILARRKTLHHRRLTDCEAKLSELSA